MARAHIGRDNWFLVIPGAILGLVALWTINQMYRAGDIRRSIEVVVDYEHGGQLVLGAFIESEESSAIDCRAELLSRFYGTLDVTCGSAETGTTYAWRVHVGQRAFAPSDEATQRLMNRYAPDVFTAEGSSGS